MDTRTQANQLRGFVESLKLSDNISKRQLEMLFSKLDLLIKTLDDELWDEASDYVAETIKKLPNKTNFEDEPDDLPF